MLYRHLSPAQRKSLLANQGFTVEGKNCRWLLGVGMVKFQQKNPIGPQRNICIEPRHTTPAADFLLGLKLAIETNEQYVLNTGCY